MCGAIREWVWRDRVCDFLQTADGRNHSAQYAGMRYDKTGAAALRRARFPLRVSIGSRAQPAPVSFYRIPAHCVL